MSTTDSHGSHRLPGPPKGPLLGRLTGPEAGWDNMHRNLASAAAVAQAEAYAAGERQLTVEHPGASPREVSSLDALISGVIDGQRPAGQVHTRTTSTDTATTWRFTGPAAREAAATARDLADLTNPGPWTVTADTH